MSNDYKYAQRGVSSNKEEVHEAIKNLDKGIVKNAFCKVMPDILGGDDEYANIMHADTAGTKTSLAYLYYKETGDISIWRGVAQDAIVMNLDDMACTGCVDNIIISSTIGRNKNMISGAVISEVIQGTNSFVKTLQEYGCNVQLAGGETADVGDIVRTIDVGITAIGRLKKEDAISIDIKPGNVIVGLASFGQSTYESEYNSGIGSNGLTSARHDLFNKTMGEKYPESFDPSVPDAVRYIGSYIPTDEVDVNGSKMNIGKLALSPTRTFLPVLKPIVERFRKDISGIIHCTGGGQVKVTKFAKGVHIIKDNLFDMPPVFDYIKEASGSSWEEMYNVFNMGNRMEIYTSANVATEIISIAKSFGIDAQLIGRVEKQEVSSTKEVDLTVVAQDGTLIKY